MGTWLVKYDGVCSICGEPLVKDTPAVWDRRTRAMRCIQCANSKALSVPPEVNHGVGGRSARAEYERRVAKHDAAITERWGTGFVGKVVRAIASEPQTTRAWAIGAAGEEKLARELESIPSLQFLNDRQVPGSRANIDHIVIAPAGVFVVDAKNYKGMVEIRNRGGFLHADNRLTVGGRDCSTMADRMNWQVEAVLAALSGTEQMPPITPVLCFLAADWPLLRAPSEFRDVRLESHRSLKRLLTAHGEFNDERILAITAVIAAALPPR